MATDWVYVNGTWYYLNSSGVMQTGWTEDGLYYLGSDGAMKTGWRYLEAPDSSYDNGSAAAVGVAAHEVGHAIQHAVGYSPIKIREAIIPVTQVGSWMYFPIILLGLVFSSQTLLNVGILLFGTIALFQLVTLPVEFNASNRAIMTLQNNGILYGNEITVRRKPAAAPLPPAILPCPP